MRLEVQYDENDIPTLSPVHTYENKKVVITVLRCKRLFEMVVTSS